MIHIEVVIPTARYQLQDQENNDRILAWDHDTIDELRDIVRIRIITHQQRISEAYNKNIKVRRFQVGDLVLRKTIQNTKDPNTGKLEPKWEGPYPIDSKVGNEAYWLATIEGNIFPRS
mgnify:CR=1 FL=1